MVVDGAAFRFLAPTLANCALWNEVDWARVLLAQGVSPTVPSRVSKEQPVVHASIAGHVEMVQLLPFFRRRGPQGSRRRRRDGLHQQFRHNSVLMVQALLDDGRVPSCLQLFRS